VAADLLLCIEPVPGQVDYQHGRASAESNSPGPASLPICVVQLLQMLS
jgi:hypothetical protein